MRVRRKTWNLGCSANRSVFEKVYLFVREKVGRDIFLSSPHSMRRIREMILRSPVKSTFFFLRENEKKPCFVPNETNKSMEQKLKTWWNISYHYYYFSKKERKKGQLDPLYSKNKRTFRFYETFYNYVYIDAIQVCVG